MNKVKLNQKIAKLYGRIGGLKNSFQWHKLPLDDYLIQRHNLLKEIERIKENESMG